MDEITLIRCYSPIFPGNKKLQIETKQTKLS